MGKNFSGQTLRGHSFKGQDLTGEDFSYADIRGANFTKAKLIGANFSHAEAGLQRRWLICLLTGSLLLSALSGLISALVGAWIVIYLFDKTISSVFIRAIVIVILAIFFTTTVRQGLEAALGYVVVTFAVTFAGALSVAMAVSADNAGSVAGLATLLAALAVAAAVAGTVAVASAGAVAGTVARVGAVIVVFVVALTIALSAHFKVATVWAVTGTVPVTVAVGLLSSYVAWRALAGDERFILIRRIAVACAAMGGTNFANADLTDANFTRSRLKNTDFRGASLTRTCWLQAKKLSLARVGESYLKEPKVRELVITGAKQDPKFDRLNLRGVNLRGANLADVSFIGTDLSESNLQEADLSRAKLVQTQIDRTDFTGACLTGAYIEDWGITAETKLNGVKCQYVYMRLPTQDDPDPCRKPDNKQEIFEDGDFADFIAPIVKTLDLYHNQGVDPRAIAIAFKRLAEKNPEAELEIVAMEKRGGDKFLLRAKTAELVDRSYLATEYFADYNYLKSLPPDKVQLLMVAQNAHIRSLETMVMTALKRPSFYAENYHNEGDTMSDKQGSVSISSVQGSVTGVAAAGQNQTGLAVGDISGEVTNTIGKLQESKDTEAPKLADLLKQLQAAIEAAPELKPEEKAEALEQVKAIAEAGPKPQEGSVQKAAKTALTMLKGLIFGLPSAAKLVEEFKKWLPAIAHLLGLA